MNLPPQCAPLRGRFATYITHCLLAAAAMMAFAASASATVVTTTTGGSAATPTIHLVSEGGHVSLANSNANIDCASTVEAAVESHSLGKPASGNISQLEFTGCTNGWTVEVNSKGSLAIHWASGHDGTATSSGTTVTAILHTIFGDITCRYATSSTDIGTLTGGNPATLDIEASIPFHSGGGLCGTGTSKWSGKYATTSALYVAIAPAAPFITSPTGSASPASFKASSEGHLLFESSPALVTCDLSMEGVVEGSSEGLAANIGLTNVSFTSCTTEDRVTVVSPGHLEIEWTSGYNGTVRWTGATIEWIIKLGARCNYATQQTDIGTITGGNPATIHIAAKLPVHSGSVFCLNGKEPTPVTGSLSVTQPSSLYVDKPS